MRQAQRLKLENRLLRDAVREYADANNWDGAGGWIHPSYGPEFAELALEGAANIAQPALPESGRLKLRQVRSKIRRLRRPLKIRG